MRKTLILAVDRDNDFGEKAGIETPVIGIDACIKAAVALGVSDPEDSDVNGLFAAIKIHNELREEGRDVEVALLCGDKNVGHISDSKVIDQLEETLDKVSPDRVILVGDGAEDEYVYPVVSSRIPIDHVKKVYVKQAPGIESAIYIFGNIIKDSEKKKRFIAPFGYLLLILGLVFVVEGIYAYIVTGEQSYIYTMTWPFIGLILGVVIILYAYDLFNKSMKYFKHTVKSIRSGNIAFTFTAISVALFFAGIGMGAYAVWNVPVNDIFYLVLSFVSNAMWPIVFSIVFRDSGYAVRNYIQSKRVNRSFMVSTIAVVGFAFLLQGSIDVLEAVMGYSYISNMMIVGEFIIGLAFAVSSSLLQSNLSRYFNSLKAVSDAKE